jgi:stringent starvation protein B
MEKNTPLTSSRPYLFRAMHEWMSDSGETPLAVVDAAYPGVKVPEAHIQDGRIVLNVSWSATGNLVMDNEAVSFNARFGGVGHTVYLPIDSIVAIYGRESGQGMVFQQESDVEQVATDAPVAQQDQQPPPSDDGPGRPNSRPNGPPGLRLVK